MEQKKLVMRSRATWLVLCFPLALGACSSSQGEPQTPNDEPDVAEILEPQAPPADGSEEASEETVSDSSPSDDPATPEDFKEALQVVIQDEALLSQLKLEEPGRFPLKISGADIPSSVELLAHTEAVEVVSAPADPKKEPVLVFTSIRLDGSSGTFKYRFEIEGVRGTSYVTKANGQWVLKSSRISQYSVEPAD